MNRDIFKKLVDWKEKKGRKVLILKGARQVGKTYLLKLFGEKYFAKTHYLNFEKEKQLCKIFEPDLNPSRILNEIAFALNRPVTANEDLLILDEIQECPPALTSLKYFQEERPQLHLCAAGSLLGVHLGESSFPVGKVEFLHMYPMSFEEFLQGIGEEQLFHLLRDRQPKDPIPEIAHERLWDLLKKYFVIGGLPAVVQTYREKKEDLFEAVRSVREKQEDLIIAYIADMAKHAGKENAMHLERLWRGVPAQLARQQDGSASKFRFKGILPSVKGYSRLASVIDWLEAAGLTLKVKIANSGFLPFPAHTQENFFKLYLFDVGILGALSQLPPKTLLDYHYGSYQGYFAENFVAEEFATAGGAPLYGWREKTAEIEFLREDDGRVVPVEIKSGWVTRSKSLKVFAEKYQPPYRVVMSAKNLHFDPRHKALQIPLYLASRFPRF